MESMLWFRSWLKSENRLLMINSGVIEVVQILNFARICLMQELTILARLHHLGEAYRRSSTKLGRFIV